MASKRAKLVKQRAKAVGRAPKWLKTVQIAKAPRPAALRGSFGAASAVVRIDPATGLPREEEQA